MLPDMKPEQLKTVVGSTEPAKKEFLFYRQNEIITVLDKCTNSPYWKGVLNSGKTGLFNPANTVTYLGSLPSSTNRDSFCRSSDRSSKRKLRTEMISRPQNDLKHTGHVGLDGAYFGDIAFMSSVQNVSFFYEFTLTLCVVSTSFLIFVDFNGGRKAVFILKNATAGIETFFPFFVLLKNDGTIRSTK